MTLNGMKNCYKNVPAFHFVIVLLIMHPYYNMSNVKQTI